MFFVGLILGFMTGLAIGMALKSAKFLDDIMYLVNLCTTHTNLDCIDTQKIMDIISDYNVK